MKAPFRWRFTPLITAILGMTAAIGASSRVDNARMEEAIRQIDAVVARGPFQASWTSLENYQVADSYLDAKFGIFIHWGVYSVPAFGNEWYPRNMYKQDTAEFKHHVATYGPHSKFGYKDFIPMFRADKFDPGHWARVFKDSGARYVVPVAEHHDGFPMYASAWTEWCAAKMGPRRDIVGELAKAARGRNDLWGFHASRGTLVVLRSRDDV